MGNLAWSGAGALVALLLTSCGSKPASDTSEPVSPATVATVWPQNLNPIGDGYPKAGDPCRRLGESPLTVNFLDDSAVLVGCPGVAADAASAALVAGGGKVIGEAEGITMISVPQGDANVGLAEAIGEQAVAGKTVPADGRKPR